MTTETRRAFHEELDELRHEVVRLGALVTESIPQATEALVTGDLEGASRVVDADDAIDTLAIEVEEKAFRLLALQQPMAGDLRFLVTAIKLNGDLERSGDLVSNLAQIARRIYPSRLTPRCRGVIEQMSGECVRLNTLAMDAYVDGNAPLAAALDDLDDRLDGLHAEFMRAIFEAHQTGDIDLPTAVQLALAARFYERIGDHAVNIGNAVQFLVTGWMPEHTGAARARARADVAAALAQSDLGDSDLVQSDRAESDRVESDRAESDRTGSDRADGRDGAADQGASP